MFINLWFSTLYLINIYCSYQISQFFSFFIHNYKFVDPTHFVQHIVHWTALHNPHAFVMSVNVWNIVVYDSNVLMKLPKINTLLIKLYVHALLLLIMHLLFYNPTAQGFLSQSSDCMFCRIVWEDCSATSRAYSAPERWES